MSSCNECLYNSDGICQNDKCSFDEDDNCYEYESKMTYDRGYQQGRNDAIEKCAEIISKNMRCESCPVDCLWGTEQKCKDTLALYLKTKIEEQKNV